VIRRLFALTWLVVFGCTAAAAEGPARQPMPVPAEHSIVERWLHKEVLRSRLLDDMENLDRWKIAYWSQGKGDISLTDGRAIDGRHSLRLHAHTRGEKPGPDGGVFGAIHAVRSFDEEDWTDYNRLSFWVYPDLPGFHAISLVARVDNHGPALGRNTHHFQLKNCQWNHVVWEIPDLARDHVAAVAFSYEMNGHEPGAAEIATFDIDHLELQQVAADHYEGWDVAPGRIAFSHTGYPSDGPKAAIAAGLRAERFELIAQASGQPVFSGPVTPATAPTGRHQVLEFSVFRRPGTYTIRAGGIQTEPFRIDDHVWTGTLRKALNFFYAERCGAEIPGVHGVCHQDWQGEHNGRRIVINGGWHDAGDLSQGLVNTSEAVYAMFDLAAQLRARGEEPALARQLVDEARWGLDWVLKTAFPDGYRIQWATMRFWTDNVPGTTDDVTAKAQRDPAGSFYAAAAEALACRVLRDEDPPLAARALAAARDDWRHAVEVLPQRRPVELASIGVLASLELFAATGDREYGVKAKELGRAIVESQQQEFLPGLEIPLTGFFYRDSEKKAFLYYHHRGHEQAPVVAMAKLCASLPDDEDWMDWYAVVVLHSQFYQAAMARLTAPYHVLPNSLHRADEYLQTGSGNRQAVREQIENGFRVGEGYYVRMFPVQPAATFRGHFGTMLSQTKAVAVAARLRRCRELTGLCDEQLYWVVGRNPFVQSTMYGEGYDFAPQYTARSGDIVGSLPVGIKSIGNRDLPYWPCTNVWNYKEVWVHPVSRWIWLMCELDGSSAIPYTKPAEDGLRWSVAAETSPGGQVTITVDASGHGTHQLVVRGHNLAELEKSRVVRLQTGSPQKLTWQCRMKSTAAPWVAVVVPDGHLDQRQEVLGSTRR
jgi:hypothetical protein